MNQGYLKVLQVLIFSRTYFTWDKGQEFIYRTFIANMKFSMDEKSNFSKPLFVATATSKGWKLGSMKSKVMELKLEVTSLFILCYSTELVCDLHFMHSQNISGWFVYLFHVLGCIRPALLVDWGRDCILLWSAVILLHLKHCVQFWAPQCKKDMEL